MISKDICKPHYDYRILPRFNMEIVPLSKWELQIKFLRLMNCISHILCLDHYKLISHNLIQHIGAAIFGATALTKGQLNSDCIYEVIFSPKMQTKIFKDFCPTKQTRIIALFLVIFW